MTPRPFARTRLAPAPRQKRGAGQTFALQRFRSAMDASADALFLIDAASLSIIDVSDGACRMLGYSRAVLLGADPVRLGLGAASELQRRARRPLDAGISTTAELADAELRCADLGTAVAVEISWRVQLQGGVRILIALARAPTAPAHAAAPGQRRTSGRAGAGAGTVGRARA